MNDQIAVSPLLDGFTIGTPVADHYGICCYPAVKENSQRRFIVKAISVPPSQTQLDALLIDRLRTLGSAGIANLPDVSEGLEMRAGKCALTSGSRDSLLDALKCKRYTHARLSRLCAHALLGLTGGLAKNYAFPRYARVLGFRAEAKPLVTHVSNQPLPLITRPALLKEDEAFRIERRATDLQSLCFPDEAARSANRDLTERMIVI